MGAEDSIIYLEFVSWFDNSIFQGKYTVTFAANKAICLLFRNVDNQPGTCMIVAVFCISNS